jgi:hypothetical protein
VTKTAYRYCVTGLLTFRVKQQNISYKSFLYLGVLLLNVVPALAQNAPLGSLASGDIVLSPEELAFLRDSTEGLPGFAALQPARQAAAVADLETPNIQPALPGTDVAAPNLNRGLAALARDNPTAVAGIVFQQAAALQQTMTGALAAVSGQVMDLGLAEVSGGGAGNAFVNAPIIVGAQSNELSMFAVSGVTKVSHEGYEASSALLGGGGKTPEFEEVDYGLTLGVRWDASSYFGLDRNTVTFGVMGNYTHTDIEIGTNAALKKYFKETGKADIDSWTLGAYGVVTDGRKYGLLTIAATHGSPSTENFVLSSTADYSTVGIAGSAMSGVLVPVGGNATLDLRGGFNFMSASADDYSDSAGIRFANAELEEISGTVSARLFYVAKFESGTFRPFIQGGLTHRFHYRNEVEVEGVSFAFDDADSSVFARAGIDFDLHRYMQAYLAVRGDHSESREAIAAQVGLTFKLD